MSPVKVGMVSLGRFTVDLWLVCVLMQSFVDRVVNVCAFEYLCGWTVNPSFDNTIQQLVFQTQKASNLERSDVAILGWQI